MNALRRQMSLNDWGPTTLVLLFILTGLTSCRCAQDPLAHGWTRVNAEPLAGAILLQQGEQSGCIWRVNQEAQKVTVSRVSNTIYEHASELRMQTATGILVGENHGEWGGSLQLLDAKGDPPKQILDKNVLQMFQVQSAVLVITGNLPANEGSLWLYSNMHGQGWAIEKKADLKVYPRAIGKSNGGILLVSSDGVYLVNDGFKILQLAALPLLDIGPNSVAEDTRGAIYIGMKAFVIRLVPNQTGYAHEWFTEPGCLP